MKFNNIENYFDIDGRNTTVKTEVVAGITTYLTMSYIIFVNPVILGKAGIDEGAVFVATCLAAAIGCLIMGLYARLPIALAPGMGLNAFFTYSVVLGMGHSWQVALGGVFWSGCIFLLLSIFKARIWIINAIPDTLKYGIISGIGAFLALIALQNSGIVVLHEGTLLTPGNLQEFAPAMAALGFLLTIGLVHRKVPGALTISFLLITVIGIVTKQIPFSGVISLPPPISPTFMQLDIVGALDVGMIGVVLSFLFVDLFDTSGTLIAVTAKADLIDAKGDIPNLDKALMADSTATTIGALLGTSSTTSFVESAAGVVVGGRTGLTAVVVGLLFILSIFFAPLASMIPLYATAGAILYVAILMLYPLKNIDWEDLTEAAPAAVVILLTPLTYSIADGIALGFVTYTTVKALMGKLGEISPQVWVLTTILLFKLIFLQSYSSL